jgi:hypothetical protein
VEGEEEKGGTCRGRKEEKKGKDGQETIKGKKGQEGKD